MHSSSTDGLNQVSTVLIWPLSLCELLQVPFSLEDPDYKGLELDVMSPCEKHGMASERLVAFEGTDTGRRFFNMCTAVAPNNENALLKLWEMVEDAKSARVNDNLESSFTIHHLTKEKNKLEANYDKLVQDVHELMNFQEDKVVDFRHLQSAITYQQEVRKELTDDMKAKMATEMAKKDAETQQLTQKYEVLLNLTRAQATVIQNLKLNKMKEKQNALLKLWAMVEDAKSARVNDNLENSFTIHHLTEEKNKLEANYDKLVQDVHELMNFQEDKVVDFRHLQSAITYQQEVRKELTDDMKAKMATEMAKKDAETQQLTQKYEVLLNLTRAQATVIQNLKLNKMKEKQVLTEASMHLELKNAELTKCQEKLTQEKLELKLQVADLLKGNKKHIEEKW
uniref:Uncharacterized protein n=1 Tax=Triticum aestivum TaxID=4565 RepID=A0A080YU63_WHEAT|nr:unnamed protein product [Triticum aestivum]